MKDELFSDDLVWRGLEAAEPYIPLDDLALALEQRIETSRGANNRKLCSSYFRYLNSV
jgi:hypothetical protein